MLNALLTDFGRMRNIEVSIVRAMSAPILQPPACVSVHYVDSADAESMVQNCMQEADAVWPLVPESDGLLSRISTKILDENRLLLGSRPSAVALTTSKHATSLALAHAGVPVVDSYFPWEKLPEGFGAWVAKPDDGAGCTDTHLFSSRAAALAWVAERKETRYILQPFIQGRHCSLSLICGSDDIVLLSLNDQRMVVSDNQLHYMGSMVNNIDDPDSRLAAFARSVVAAIPGLWGYVGIDFIMSAAGPVVLEINPRMTTSHAGLHDSMGCNPAELVMDLVRGEPCRIPSAARVRPVSVDLNTFQDKGPALHPQGMAY